MERKILSRSVFAGLAAAALGFGATQAFAAPSAQSARFACEPWDEPRCIEYCQNLGADTGTCNVQYVNRCKCIYW
jgi:hypothetical protein